MYCPKCAAPIEGVKFCRGCGTNVSLVPQALTGRIADLPTEAGHQGARQKKRAATMENAATNFFMGIGFILVSLAIARFMPGGASWWFWMLIPGFACIGSGVGQYLRVRAEPRAVNYVTPPSITSAAAQYIDAPKAPTTSNLSSKVGEQGSVTEDTTRHL